MPLVKEEKEVKEAKLDIQEFKVKQDILDYEV